MPLPYHRLFRAVPSHRWWRPLLAVVVAVLAYVVLANAVVLALVAVLRATGGPEAVARLSEALATDPLAASDPVVMLVTLGSIATMVPAVLLGATTVGRGAVGRLWSVEGRLRWRWLACCLPAGAVFVAVSTGLGAVVVPVLLGEPVTPGPVTTPPSTLLWSVLVVVLLVPLQATGEELAFRGLGQQVLGAWVARPVVAVVVPTVGFALAHQYNVWGVLDVAVFGVAAAWLTWRTGGLEAAIVAHVLNNVVLFLLLAPFAGTESGDGSPLGLAVTLVAVPTYAALVLRAARRHAPARVLRPPVLPSGAAVPPSTTGGATS